MAGKRLYRTEAEAVTALRDMGEYTVDVTGDACVGDEVAFARATFTGSYRKPKFAGYEVVRGTIVRDSYGAKKQQHTFTIETDDGQLLIKGRNLYSVLTLAKPRDERERRAALAEKHERGEAARSAREQCREAERPW